MEVHLLLLKFLLFIQAQEQGKKKAVKKYVNKIKMMNW